MKKRSWIVYISTYPPRQCGIATFTKDLTTAINDVFYPRIKSKIVAMNREANKRLHYPKEVIFKIKEHEIEDYISVAHKINRTKAIKAVNIQHEFGIYGGRFLNYLTGFLETINKPVVVTLHSVVPNPPESIRNTMQYLAKKSSAFIVIANKAVKILRKDYGIKTRIVVVPHGIHKVKYVNPASVKRRLGYKNNLILSSFGLISGGKSYEDIIKAMPSVVKKFPNALYFIIGKTHPGILKDEGEKYRNRLKKLIKKLKLEKNVKFVNKYLPLKELLRYLQATDIFVSSGKGTHQISSGTLIYAMGCGRPVITIPFLHAKEAVTKNRGILVKLGSPSSFARAIIKLLSKPKLRKRMGKNAYEYTRLMTWDNVAKSYMRVFKECIKKSKRR